MNDSGSDNRSDAGVRYGDNFFSEDWFKNWEILKLVLCGLIEAIPKWKRILDFGCGPGVMIDLMNARGHEYIGCEISPEARELYLRRYGKHPDKCFASLSELAGRPFDLMLSFAVLEHMKDGEIAHLLESIPQVPEALVNISRMRGIPGHINLKPDRSWIAFFESQGWAFQQDLTEALRAYYLLLRPDGGDLWHKNMFLLKRITKPVK